MRKIISFETTISTDTINIPEEWRDAITSSCSCYDYRYLETGKI